MSDVSVSNFGVLILKHIEVKAQDGYHNEVKYKVEAGEENGSPLQCSCLENSMDSEAWALAGVGCTCVIYKYNDGSGKKKKKQPFSKNLHKVMDIFSIGFPYFSTFASFCPPSLQGWCLKKLMHI